jgi:carbonic anhydrase/acetyltransferase-like protein (isoleucine patch superfamily)
MAIYSFEGKRPKIGKETYIADSADVIGDVTIGENCYIGPGARIKGDYGKVKIGKRTSIQENCIIHARPGEICKVGGDVNIGHGAILHNCTVQNSAIIGMGAIVSDWAIVRKKAIVAEGAVVQQSQEIPENNVAVGVPARIIGRVSKEKRKEWQKYSGIYAKLAKRYLKNLKPINASKSGNQCEGQ